MCSGTLPEGDYLVIHFKLPCKLPLIIFFLLLLFSNHAFGIIALQFAIFL